ncbi:type II toxin-antitoxin system VapB family antitoxin [Kordiimonas pumila]|uniref:Type II toxin-antitoxin system VapB family antitoxin n=1 Tax=Kordiimonas pumila TaxID=2161677 RepID=A0ABV7D6W0_9PROT|nr:type II toxin-antitoxin system VapB family antitoxin [Kordiimonas pumila]
MRTNIEIDDTLMEAAMKAAGSATKKAAVEEGLRLIVRLGEQRDLRKLRGSLQWEGSLEDMRRDA